MNQIVDVYSIEVGNMVMFIENNKKFVGIVTVDTDDFWTVEVATPRGAEFHNVVADDIVNIL